MTILSCRGTIDKTKNLPWRKPQKTLIIGGRSIRNLRAYVRENIVCNSGYEDGMLTKKAGFYTLQHSTPITLAYVTPYDLGFGENPSVAEFYHRALEHDLGLCHPETAIYFLDALTEWPSASIAIAMKQIVPPDDSSRWPRIFEILRDEFGRRILNARTFHPSFSIDIEEGVFFELSVYKEGK